MEQENSALSEKKNYAAHLVSVLALMFAGFVGAYIYAPFDRASQAPQDSAIEASLTMPKLRPGEWIDARLLQGSDTTLRQRGRVNAQLERRSQIARSGTNWEFIGPDNIGGRVVDLVVDPANGDVIYAAAASGGIWRSADAGDTFTSVWPANNAQAMGALAMSSTGILYAGTGESNPGGGSLTYGSSGVFASSNGGASWTSLGLVDSERISRIVVDADDPNRIFVAATGPLYSPGGERGVYRSLDGGATWTLVLAGLNNTTGASDIVIDPVNPNRLYAAMWDHLRQPALRRYGGDGSGFYRSDDGGDSWTRLGPANGLPAMDPDVGRVSITLAPSQPNTLYAMYLTTRGFYSSAWRSDDGGSVWSQLPNDPDLVNSQASFGWWFARIWVDPQNSEHVFVAGVPLAESNDGGQTFIAQNTIHADQHAMAWDPSNSNRVYLGNDGGVYRSENNGSAPWVFASRQPFTQLYTLDVGQQDSSRIVAGSQDNRCLRSYDNNGADFWNRHGLCGDGLENLINPINQDIVYSCSQYGFCGVSFDGGASTVPIGPVASIRRNWQTPLAFDPQSPATIYYAGNVVERSDDNGANWITISPDLTGGDPFPTPIDPFPFGTVSALAVSAASANKLMAGTDGGRVWRYNDAIWTQLTAANLPTRWVTRVLIDPNNDDIAYLSYSGFRDADNTPYVFKTENFGDTWTDISANLPSAPINALDFDSVGALVAAGDAGVFRRQIDGSWQTVGAGLPLVPVTDIRLSANRLWLFAATFGRGVWQVELTPVDQDPDGDMIDAANDNCLNVANTDQIDTDGDGFGNACDADFDQSCVINFLDVSLWSDNFLGTNMLYDLNNDGAVNFLDLTLVAEQFLAQPGPSGVMPMCTPG